LSGLELFGFRKSESDLMVRQALQIGERRR